jgi:transcriptional regulator with GAF, ATPase, and Fis domain
MDPARNPADATVARVDALAGRLSSTFIRLSGGEIGTAVEDALREIAGILDAERATLVEYAAESSTVLSTHTWARSGIGPYELPRPDLVPIESTLVIPIHVGDRPACALYIDGVPGHREWPAARVDGLRFIGQILGGALHRRRHEFALDRTLPGIARRHRHTEPNGTSLPGEIQNIPSIRDIVGDSAAFKEAMQRVHAVAPTDATVLLLGETGTGKEIVARALHEASARRLRPLVRVNCGALPATLIESELFGLERGSFTGAVAARQGRFELADRGTIFLDEIGDLPLELQPKLLRVLQEGEFERIGSSRSRKVDVRVIAATHHDLEAAVDAGTFRADLFYRISVFPIALPPLRERQSDIPALVWYFIQQRAALLHRHIREVPESVMQALQSYDWPGNVRELENVVERAMIRSTGDTLVLDQPLEYHGAPGAATAAQEGQATLEDVDRRHVAEVLRSCDWRINGPGNAAERLGLHPNTLRFRMKKLGITRPAKEQ